MNVASDAAASSGRHSIKPGWQYWTEYACTHSGQLEGSRPCPTALWNSRIKWTKWMSFHAEIHETVGQVVGARRKADGAKPSGADREIVEEREND